MLFPSSNDIEEGGSDKASNCRAVERKSEAARKRVTREWTRGVGVVKGRKVTLNGGKEEKRVVDENVREPGEHLSG